MSGVVGLAVFLFIFQLWLYPAYEYQRVGVYKVRSKNNLQHIGMAMHSFVGTYGAFPPAAYCDERGTPLYSWRVLLLPFLEETNLYDRFKPNEPWDSPSNKPLLAKMPRVYMDPKQREPKEPYATYYQVFTGGGAIFDHRHQPILGFADISDGCSRTFTVVEAGNPVPWTKPEDLPYSPDQALPKIGGMFSDGFNALTADGAVHWVPRNTKEKTIRATFTYRGGEAEFLKD